MMTEASMMNPASITDMVVSEDVSIRTPINGGPVIAARPRPTVMRPKAGVRRGRPRTRTRCGTVTLVRQPEEVPNRTENSMNSS